MLALRMNMTVIAPGLVSGTGRQWTESDSLRLAMLIGAFIVAVVGLGVVILVIRRRLFAREHDMSGARSLMDQLRDMRDRGEMSDEEYETTRKALAAKVASSFKGGPHAAAPVPRPARIPRIEPVANPGARVARPGYDLTGEPLPGMKSPGHTEPPAPPGYTGG